jgi:hypothetical protein
MNVLQKLVRAYGGEELKRIINPIRSRVLIKVLYKVDCVIMVA